MDSRARASHDGGTAMDRGRSMVLVRMNADRGCFLKDVKLVGGPNTISASVGAGGRNLPDDVRTVQTLLNGVSPANGGPVPKLAVDGFIGPKTNAAILAFQKRHFSFHDGKVDPGGPTLAKLNELSSAAKPAGGLAGSNADVGSPGSGGDETLRLATAISVLPDTRTAIIAAIRRTEQADSFVRTGGGGLGIGRDSFAFADKHFLFGNQGSERTLSDLNFIRVSFERMRSIIDGRISVFGSPMFGRTILDIDPHPDETPRDVKGYVPKQRVEQTDGTTAHRLYLAAGLDGKPRDQYIFTMIHELGHYVDDEDPAHVIEDRGYAFFGTVNQLNHRDRMHNADNFAMYAFENSFGRPRMVALYPKLA
jgi:hypothetical protein